MNDLVKRGFKLRQLQIPLWLRNSTSSATASGNEADSNEDILSRMRWVTQIATLSTTTNSLTLQGTNDKSTYNNIKTITPTVTGESSTLFTPTYKYYRISETLTSWINYKSYLIETTYDILFAYYWLYLILHSMKEPLRSYAEDYLKLYFDFLNTCKIPADETDTDTITDDDIEGSNEVTISRG